MSGDEISLDLRHGAAGEWLDGLRRLHGTGSHAGDPEAKRKQRRDGYAEKDWTVKGFFAHARRAGEMKVLFGTEPGERGRYIAVTFAGAAPCWRASLDHCIHDAWIAEDTGDFLCAVALPEVPGFEGDERRTLYLLFSGADGCVKLHFQHKRHVRVLGLSEDGSMYVRHERGRLHLGKMPPCEDLYIWSLPPGFHPNSAAVSGSIVRLALGRGDHLEYCWEDIEPSQHERVDRELAEEPSWERRGALIRREWQGGGVKSSAMADMLFRRLCEIPLEEIRESSFFGVDWPSIMQMKVEMLEALGREGEIEGLRADLAAFMGPYEIAETSVGKSEDAKRAGDVTEMYALREQFLFALDSKVLRNDTYRHADLNRALGHIAEGLGDFAEAILRYEKALSLNANAGCRNALKGVLKRHR